MEYCSLYMILVGHLLISFHLVVQGPRGLRCWVVAVVQV